MYAGSGASHFEPSLELTRGIIVTLVTLHRVCSVTSVTLHTSFFSVTSVTLHKSCSKFTCEVNCRASYLSRHTGPVIGPDLQGQLSVQTYRASYRSRPTGPVIGPDLQGQLLVQTYRASYRSRTERPVIGSELHGQLSV